MGGVVSSLVFQPPTPATYHRDPNLIWLNTSRGNVIPAFFIDRDAKYTLLFSHGNAEDLGMIIQMFREISQHLSVNVLAYDYTGYGVSSGKTPSEEDVYADVEAAYNYLTNVVGIPWQNIIMYGRSLGSGPSFHIASNFPVRGLIVQSGLASAFRVAFDSRFTLPGDMFRNCDKIHKVCCPILIIHGTRDEIVPLWHGQELFKRAPYPVEPYWVPEGGHNNLETMARETMFNRMYSYIQYLDSNPLPDALIEQAKKYELAKANAKGTTGV